MTPITNFEFVCARFEKCRDISKKQGRNESAQLWSDGLEHLRHERACLEEAVGALEWAHDYGTFDAAVDNPLHAAQMDKMIALIAKHGRTK